MQINIYLKKTLAHLMAFTLLSIHSLNAEVHPALGSQTKPKIAASSPNAESSAKRPIRLGHIKLSPPTDAVKPVALSHTGWILAGDQLVGSYDSSWMRSISSSSMKHEWWLSIPNEPSVQPIHDQGNIYCGFKNGSVWKIDLKTGVKIWEQNLDSFLAKIPTVNENILLAVSANHSLYAIDTSSGKVKWVYHTHEQDSLYIQNSAQASVKENVVYLGLSQGDIVALDLKTGKVLWEHSPSPLATSSRFKDVMGPIQVTTSSIIFTRYDGIIEAISLQSNHSPIWRKEIFTITDNVLSQGRLIVGTQNGYVISLNPSNGQELWRNFIGKSINSLSVHKDKIYVSTAEGQITAITFDQGKTTWHDRLNSRIVSKPFFINDAVYFQTSMRNLYAYRIQ